MVQPRIILATWLAAFQQASHGGAFASSHQYRLLFASINDHQTPVASLSYSQLPKPRRVQRRRSSSNTGPPPPQPELLLLLAAAEATTETTGDFESRQASSYKNETTKKDSVIAAETNIDHAVSSMPRGGGDAGSSVEPMEEEEESSLSSSSSSKDLVLPSLPVPELPTMMQYVKFALPCLGLWIAGPLLSLVDTSFVGLSGSSDMSARRLAALGPATTFMDGATYLFAFLNVATTNLYSSARATADVENGNKNINNNNNNMNDKNDSAVQGVEQDVNLAAESVVRTAVRVSLRCGFGILVFLLLLCKPLLRLYIGPDVVDATPELLTSATNYVRIRALHMPTSLLLGVLQAALLGAKDSVTPLIAILYSTVINISGDYILVNRLNLGLSGAAVATTLAQWASTAALLMPARRELVHDHHLGIVGKRRKVEKNSIAKDNDVNKVNVEESKKNFVTSKSFLGFAAPVLTLILGKLAAFGFMTNAAAGVPGQPTPLAAHQIILSLLFFCSPFLEVISQTAQTFLPPFLAPIQNYLAAKQQQGEETARSYTKEEEEEEAAALRPWYQASQRESTTLLGLSIVTASAIASLVSLIPAYFGGILTSDTTVQKAVRPLAKYLWLGAFAWAPVAVGEGVLLARRELGFLAIVYLLSTAMVPPSLFLIKLRQGSVDQVWLMFGLFQIFRAICFTGRIWWGPFLWQQLRRGFRRSNKESTMTVNPSEATSS